MVKIFCFLLLQNMLSHVAAKRQTLLKIGDRFTGHLGTWISLSTNDTQNENTQKRQCLSV